MRKKNGGGGPRLLSFLILFPFQNEKLTVKVQGGRKITSALNPCLLFKSHSTRPSFLLPHTLSKHPRKFFRLCIPLHSVWTQLLVQAAEPIITPCSPSFYPHPSETPTAIGHRTSLPANFLELSTKISCLMHPSLEHLSTHASLQTENLSPYRSWP